MNASCSDPPSMRTLRTVWRSACHAGLDGRDHGHPRPCPPRSPECGQALSILLEGHVPVTDSDTAAATKGPGAQGRGAGGTPRVTSWPSPGSAHWRGSCVAAAGSARRPGTPPSSPLTFGASCTECRGPPEK